VRKFTKIEIIHDEDTDLDFILTHITKLVEQGYTSGGEGNLHWDLETNNMETNDIEE
jgi:hypothetical protein